MDASKETIEQNEGFVVPTTRASARGAEDLTPVIDSEIVRSCGERGLEASVLMCKSSEALLQDDVRAIGRRDSPRHSSFRKLGR